MKTIDPEELRGGEVFFAFMRYNDDKARGKLRPIVAIKDPEDETWRALKVTSRLDKKLNHKYGYLLTDWKEAGLSEPSIVKCNREDIQELDPRNIRNRRGELTRRDMAGLLSKLLRVREIEYRRERQPKDDWHR